MAIYPEDGIVERRMLSLRNNKSVISEWFTYCVIIGDYKYEIIDGKLMITIPIDYTDIVYIDNNRVLTRGNDVFWLIDQTIENVNQLYNERLVKHCIQSSSREEYYGYYLEDLLNFLHIQDVDATQFYVRVE
jgi:hypothetical protein